LNIGSLEERMTQLTLHRKVALAAALISALSLAGATLAASPNAHASPTAVTHANGTGTDTDTDTSDNSAHGDAVSVAAQSDLTGGPHDNHGGYVSCVARGGSDCTTTTPTLPAHGSASSHSQADAHSH
jgi:hypothetical protein